MVDVAAIEASNLPSNTKSQLRRWVDSARSGGFTKMKLHAASTGHAIRQGGEALIVGGALGYVAAVRPEGLDIKAGMHTVPLDLVGGALGLAVSIATAGEEYSTDLRNAASDAISIGAYRQTEKFIKARRAAGGAPIAPPAAAAAGTPAVAGDYGEDPIVAAARAL